MSCMIKSFKFTPPPHTHFFYFVSIKVNAKSFYHDLLVHWRRTVVLWSDAAMSSLRLCAPLFTSICSEIGNWNWPCHCLPWPLIWVSFTFSYTPLVFLSEHYWLQQGLMSPDMWVKHRDRGWILKRQHSPSAYSSRLSITRTSRKTIKMTVEPNAVN